jgi:hypothetical protein
VLACTIVALIGWTFTGDWNSTVDFHEILVVFGVGMAPIPDANSAVFQCELKGFVLCSLSDDTRKVKFL